jgi:hypothetical protein
MKKQEYMKPDMKMVKLRHRYQILTGSVDTYNMNRKLQSEEVDEAY